MRIRDSQGSGDILGGIVRESKEKMKKTMALIQNGVSKLKDLDPKAVAELQTEKDVLNFAAERIPGVPRAIAEKLDTLLSVHGQGHEFLAQLRGVLKDLKSRVKRSDDRYDGEAAPNEKLNQLTEPPSSPSTGTANSPKKWKPASSIALDSEEEAASKSPSGGSAGGGPAGGSQADLMSQLSKNMQSPLSA